MYKMSLPVKIKEKRKKRKKKKKKAIVMKAIIMNVFCISN